MRFGKRCDRTKYKRGKITSKHCAASALLDKGKSINKSTKIAAKKQGMTKNTEIIGIADGADNCWKIIDSLREHCKSITKVLDWFHIAMKFQNVSLQKQSLKEKITNAKWFLWHGKTKECLERLEEIKSSIIKNDKEKKKIEKLITYINNNSDTALTHQ